MLSFKDCLAQIGQTTEEQVTSQHSKFRQVFSLKAVHLLAFFILVYVGVEASKTQISSIHMLTACMVLGYNRRVDRYLYH